MSLFKRLFAALIVLFAVSTFVVDTANADEVVGEQPAISEIQDPAPEVALDPAEQPAEEVAPESSDSDATEAVDDSAPAEEPVPDPQAEAGGVEAPAETKPEEAETPLAAAESGGSGYVPHFHGSGHFTVCQTPVGEGPWEYSLEIRDDRAIPSSTDKWMIGFADGTTRRVVSSDLRVTFTTRVLPDGTLAGVWTNTDEVVDLNVIVTAQPECLTSVVEAVPAAHTVRGPGCKTNGSLDIPVQPEGVLVSPEPGTYGPGAYNVTYSAAEGIVLTADPSGHVVVLAATGYQDENPDASCYVHRNPTEHSTHSKREGCKLGGVERTTMVTTTTWNFDEATQAWVSTEESATSSKSFRPYTRAQLEAKGCVTASSPPPVLPNTGSPASMLGAGFGGFGAIVAGIWLLASAHRRKAVIEG